MISFCEEGQSPCSRGITCGHPYAIYIFDSVLMRWFRYQSSSDVWNLMERLLGFERQREICCICRESDAAA